MAIQTRALSTAVLTAALTLGGSPSDAQQAGRGRWDIVEVVGQHGARFESGYIAAGSTRQGAGDKVQEVFTPGP